ncbi:DNA-binding response regulator, LytR/AlgR family [Pseudobutyrivibrio sp. 49]|uniref:LytR/AlgR family response regulator transcription factor n=1 Tax=unclassified Pseudobutyrivibrio TaxID=2638619 RepID=UPI000888444E|nr:MULTISPECIES: LytTR family DNA-binding domain-containing protein [unclassified Pseudobutyrivibrio]SDI05465.1 DNA-binding response regulator, LytR/AlgR family [Pseudobutyrivibrio sp. 49]SFO11486.1 two component transcriptional regulator, LytTR family [Pseudobutyrivibrio sp. UC1225]
MRVAVIDDESIFRMQLKMMVEKVAAKRALTLEVEEFETGQSFVDALTERRFDIVFMDIYMPDMDGIETAKKLRELTEKTFLIFMTASEGHYPDAFSLHAFDYVTKPFTLERIDNLISEIVDHTPIDAIFIKITVGSVDERIYLKNIVSVTTDGHYLEIHKDDGESSRVRLTSGEFLAMTGADKRFIMINRGIIINMDFIDRIDGGDVYLDDRTIFPMSAKKIADITQQIRDYQFSNN